MFHSRFNRVLAAATWVFCGGAVVAVAMSGWNVTVQYLPAIALIAWLAWAGLWRPSLDITDDGVTIVNVFATTDVPWEALIDVDTRYALTLVTPHHRYPVTVAPAPGRLATALSKRDMRGLSAPTGSDGSVRPGDLPNSDSGAAAQLVRQRWQNLLAEERIVVGTADDTVIPRRIHLATIVISIALLLASIAALVLG
ncbi:hypothetical protein BKA04_002045 [Cryobacterium mesophilum]|uniref:PH domain-containing protein n=1 Tax=Terrimesophilobacter mesophilus TaxID=433647 RepID=A0A4R8VB41_9MICO|nr:PH domain-containing protein [Terrimesophilobacter mesophilus]MBB5633822.1 hypothetical protein [Terrimesophilobacter mesophilus]TFB80501.1 PH domain-containing protein [Terrimesophilobacter mesophilus]